MDKIEKSSFIIFFFREGGDFEKEYIYFYFFLILK